MKSEITPKIYQDIPIFPLPSCIISQGTLPLNIFEPRYIAMIEPISFRKS